VRSELQKLSPDDRDSADKHLPSDWQDAGNHGTSAID
jgi:hypothetical protein